MSAKCIVATELRSFLTALLFPSRGLNARSADGVSSQFEQ